LIIGQFFNQADCADIDSLLCIKVWSF